MSTGVPHVDYSATVLEACGVMNKTNFSGIIVFDEDKAVGMVTDKALLRRFIPLNKRPDEVNVSEVMAPLLKIDAEASTKEAARKLVENRYSRLEVFDGDKLLGWVSLTDLTREISEKHLLDALRRHNEPEVEGFLCPNCRKAFLDKIMNKGQISRWECSKCRFVC